MLYKILQWLQQNGEVKAMDRLRMIVLPACLKEKVYLNRVDAGTNCSNGLLDTIRSASTDIVGSKCPH